MAVVAALAVTGGAIRGEPAAGAPGKPNVVLITTDDQTAASMFAMRRVDSVLAAQGTTFSNMIASFPLCCPARASWITGAYAHNHGVLDNTARNGGGYESLREPTRVLPAWLNAAGYDTVMIGKWLHDYRPLTRPPGWDVFHGLVPPTVTRYFNSEVTDSRGGKVALGVAEEDYLTDALTRRYAIPYIYGQAGDPDPFFLHLSFTAPHWGTGRNDDAGRRCASGKPFSFETARAKPAPRHATRFRRTPLPKPPSFDERDLSDKPAGVRGRKRRRPKVEAVITTRYRCELASLLAVDEAVNQVNTALEATGAAGETYVIFTSDNGYMHGEHRIRAEKVQPYDEALRVPFVIRGPGIPAGATVADPVANVDLAPTIMDLADASQPLLGGRAIDGISLIPYLAGYGHPGRAVLIEAKRPPRRTTSGQIVAPSFLGIRTRRYTYVEHYRAPVATLEQGHGLPIGAGSVTDRELYDHEVDPFELESRHLDPASAQVRASLAAAAATLRSCTGAGCLLDVAVPPPG